MIIIHKTKTKKENKPKNGTNIAPSENNHNNIVMDPMDRTNNTKRRIVSINACHKNEDGTYTFIGTSRWHGTVRNTKTKVNRIR